MENPATKECLESGKCPSCAVDAHARAAFGKHLEAPVVVVAPTCCLSHHPPRLSSPTPARTHTDRALWSALTLVSGRTPALQAAANKVCSRTLAAIKALLESLVKRVETERLQRPKVSLPASCTHALHVRRWLPWDQ